MGLKIPEPGVKQGCRTCEGTVNFECLKSDKPNMATPKIPSEIPHHLLKRKRPPASPDIARDVFWLAIILQGLYLAGVYKKIGFLQSNLIFYSIILVPALVFVLANTWKSAVKYSILCSLIFPATATLLLLIIAALGLIKNGGDILPKIKMSLSTGGTIWMVLIVTIIPAVILGAIARLCRTYFRRNSN